MSRLVPLAVLLAVLCTACQVRLATDVVVRSDGSGTLELSVVLDDELAEDLEAAGFDLLGDVDHLRELAPRWIVEPVEVERGSGVLLRIDFADPADFTAVTGDLHAALDAEDGSLWQDLRLEVDGDGAATFSGRAGLVPPSSPGADGADLQVDEGDLAELLRDRGSEFATYDLRVTLPGRPRAHDGDERVGRTVVWHLPIGSSRAVEASAPAPVGTTIPATVALVLLATTAGALAVVVARRQGRRRARRAEARDALRV